MCLASTSSTWCRSSRRARCANPVSRWVTHGSISGLASPAAGLDAVTPPGTAMPENTGSVRNTRLFAPSSPARRGNTASPTRWSPGDRHQARHHRRRRRARSRPGRATRSAFPICIGLPDRLGQWWAGGDRHPSLPRVTGHPGRPDARRPTNAWRHRDRRAQGNPRDPSIRQASTPHGICRHGGRHPGHQRRGPRPLHHEAVGPTRGEALSDPR